MIAGIGFVHTKFNFPCGELHIEILPTYVQKGKRVSIHFEYENNEEIIELLLLCNALKKCGMILEGIAMPYVPYGRQDRVNFPGQPLSIEVFANLINSCEAKVVNITDPHSDVTTALIKNCEVIEQYEALEKYFDESVQDFWLISPDAGASKKIYKLAKKVKIKGIIECSKTRDLSTGDILYVTVHAKDLGYTDCYIVDDICDGGKTFIEIAKKLKKINCGKIVLLVTHGFFTKGLDVFHGYIDEIYTKDGRMK